MSLSIWPLVFVSLAGGDVLALVEVLGVRWNDRAMTISIPSGQPNYRFTRYVRPPVKEGEEHQPLFALRPATRPLRLGIDTTTVPVPPDGYLSRFFGHDEIDIQLLVPVGEEISTAWKEVLHQPVVRQIGFTSIDKAGRELDTVYFWITTESEQEHWWARVGRCAGLSWHRR